VPELQYNEILRRKGNRVDDPDYTNQKFNDIFSYIVQSKILTDIRHQENLAARLGERLKMSMISYCKRQSTAVSAGNGQNENCENTITSKKEHNST